MDFFFFGLKVGIKHMSETKGEETVASMESVAKGLKVLTYEVQSMGQEHIGTYTCHATSIAGQNLPNVDKRFRRVKVAMKGMLFFNPFERNHLP